MKQHSRQIRNIVLLTSSLMLAAIGILSCSYDIVLEGDNCSPACDEGRICENGICVYKCDPECGEGQVCKEGRCIGNTELVNECEPACAEGQDCCESVCVDLNTNENCGACGNKCGSNEQCFNNSCRCKDGATTCGGQCVFLNEDVNHCGACDNVCEEGQSCCNEQCVELGSNDHCSACGDKCGEEQECDAGQCICAGSESEEKTKCGEQCVDLQDDTENCGECGKKCEENQICKNGQCECEDSNELLCDSQCVSRNDMLNCGECGKACIEESEICNGVNCIDKPAMDNCETICNPNQECCNGECKDPGSYTDDNNCGQCGLKCEDSFHCIEGKCQCQADSSACDGKCVKLNDNNEHCGACNHACGANQKCRNGECRCEGLENWGKEACGDQCVNLKDNSEHCGSCDNKCDDGLTCRNSKCQCPEPGKLYCHSECIEQNDDNCGDCGIVCGSNSSCDKGRCACNNGYTDCGAGCISLRDDSENCGICGKKCGNGQRCVNGECACDNETEALCNTTCVDLSTDAKNCGVCGKECTNGLSCNNGICSNGQDNMTFSCGDLTCMVGMTCKTTQDNSECIFDISNVGKSFVLLEPGEYKFEVWGASGGGTNNKRGYSIGKLTLNQKTKAFIHVGGEGIKCDPNHKDCGGYNGGGNGNYEGMYSGYGGGGATDIRLNEDTLYHRLIVAGGGGGSDDHYGQPNDGKGGNGGGSNGGDGSCKGNQEKPKGGSQLGEDALFGMGESVSISHDLGGGGGGWYGGGASNCSTCDCGGGGGSGYVLTVNSSKPSGYQLESEYYFDDGAETKTDNSSGPGSVKITLLNNIK